MEHHRDSTSATAVLEGWRVATSVHKSACGSKFKRLKKIFKPSSPLLHFWFNLKAYLGYFDQLVVLGVGSFFSRGGSVGFFSKIFPGGAKSGEICFFPTQNIIFFAENFKIQERPWTPCFPLPTPMRVVIDKLSYLNVSHLISET